ncbi:MAG: hypothetical protein AAF791_05450 [Bacteroidota bacterium]
MLPTPSATVAPVLDRDAMRRTALARTDTLLSIRDRASYLVTDSLDGLNRLDRLRAVLLDGVSHDTAGGAPYAVPGGPVDTGLLSLIGIETERTDPISGVRRALRDADHEYETLFRAGMPMAPDGVWEEVEAPMGRGVQTPGALVKDDLFIHRAAGFGEGVYQIVAPDGLSTWDATTRPRYWVETAGSTVTVRSNLDELEHLYVRVDDGLIRAQNWAALVSAAPEWCAEAASIGHLTVESGLSGSRILVDVWQGAPKLDLATADGAREITWEVPEEVRFGPYGMQAYAPATGSHEEFTILSRNVRGTWNLRGPDHLIPEAMLEATRQDPSAMATWFATDAPGHPGSADRSPQFDPADANDVDQTVGIERCHDKWVGDKLRYHAALANPAVPLTEIAARAGLVWERGTVGSVREEGAHAAVRVYGGFSLGFEPRNRGQIDVIYADLQASVMGMQQGSTTVVERFVFGLLNLRRHLRPRSRALADEVRPWVAGPYDAGVLVHHDGRMYRSDAAVLSAAEVPGTAAVWVEVHDLWGDAQVMRHLYYGSPDADCTTIMGDVGGCLVPWHYSFDATHRRLSARMEGSANTADEFGGIVAWYSTSFRGESQLGEKRPVEMFGCTFEPSVSPTAPDHFDRFATVMLKGGGTMWGCRAISHPSIEFFKATQVAFEGCKFQNSVLSGQTKRFTVGAGCEWRNVSADISDLDDPTASGANPGIHAQQRPLIEVMPGATWIGGNAASTPLHGATNPHIRAGNYLLNPTGRAEVVLRAGSRLGEGAAASALLNAGVNRELRIETDVCAFASLYGSNAGEAWQTSEEVWFVGDDEDTYVHNLGSVGVTVRARHTTTGDWIDPTGTLTHETFASDQDLSAYRVRVQRQARGYPYVRVSEIAADGVATEFTHGLGTASVLVLLVEADGGYSLGMVTEADEETVTLGSAPAAGLTVRTVRLDT